MVDGIHTGEGLSHVKEPHTKEGAEAIKKRLEEKWPADVYDLEVKIINVGFHVKMREARYDVRTNMINGLPPKKKDA